MLATLSQSSRPSFSFTRFSLINFRLLLAISILGTSLIAQSDEIKGAGDGKSVQRKLAEQQFLSYQGQRDSSFKPFIDGRRTLHIEGTDAAETIIAEVSSDPASIAIEYRTDATQEFQKSSFRFDGFDRLILNARGGSDFVNIIDAAELLDTHKKILKLDGGDGKNIVVLSHLPFKPETALEIMQLSNLSEQIEGIAKRASDATSRALAVDAMKLIGSIRVDLSEVSKTISADAEKRLFGPARVLVDRDGTQLMNLGNSFKARSENLIKQHDRFVADLTRKNGLTNGVPPEDDSEQGDRPGTPPRKRPDPNRVEKENSIARTRAERIMQDGLRLGGDAKVQVEQRARQMENDAAEIDRRAGEFEKRLEQLSTNAEALAAQGEKDLTASAERVLAVVEELKSMLKDFGGAELALRDEIQRAVSLRPEQRANTAKASATGCNTSIATTQTYVGGGFFLPISAPWASWSITGSSGSDFLIGGFVDDDIHGGDGDDIILGLKGNDHIHGDDGVDLLLGEFLWDINFITGDDCVWGDNDVDLVVGDNLIDTPTGTSGERRLAVGWQRY